jgi:hypothetical protein
MGIKPIGSKPWGEGATNDKINGVRMRPSKKNGRQDPSPKSKSKVRATIPVMPITRPNSTKAAAADKPINNPPDRERTGVNSVIFDTPQGQTAPNSIECLATLI